MIAGAALGLSVAALVLVAIVLGVSLAALERQPTEAAQPEPLPEPDP